MSNFVVLINCGRTRIGRAAAAAFVKKGAKVLVAGGPFEPAPTVIP
jgi:NAD(P)-dependent dehydrogenase (short-subunit alcohol dehydrogenase family)